MARAHYQAVTTFISETVDNLYSQSPWLMEPPKEKPKNTRGGGRDANLFTGKPGKDTDSDSGDKAARDQAKLKEMQAKYGPCPACHKGHTFKSNRSDQMIASSRMDSCKKLADKTPDQLVDFLIENNACTSCMSWLHVRADCIYEKMTCPVKVNGVPCGKPHHKLLHHISHPQPGADLRPRW